MADEKQERKRGDKRKKDEEQEAKPKPFLAVQFKGEGSAQFTYDRQGVTSAMLFAMSAFFHEIAVIETNMAVAANMQEQAKRDAMKQIVVPGQEPRQ